ncbi:unnamed protein product [Cuscuta campestris]|uniref:Protein kinase domain-containing protein n=1 Tax=Cuscuta campestris TaxID=132261 RepID=A0A484L9U5_9ASTE|nr:unnamed protein product [Cuscuta campestris]
MLRRRQPANERPDLQRPPRVLRDILENGISPLSKKINLPLHYFKFTFYLLLTFVPLLVNSHPRLTDRDVLLELKRRWGNPSPLRHWNATSPSPCSWPEIGCSGDGSVAGIFLSNYNITSEIPSEICDLKNVTTLDLSFNYFPGEFPAFLYNCSKLEYLDLSQNYFVGPIPRDIDRLRELRHLNLGSNNFTGDIPRAVGNLSELRDLKLCCSQFNGTFPVEIGNLSHLENLDMSFNNFSPSRIPEEFCNLKNLKVTRWTSANLVGKIPKSFDNLSSMVQLDLAENRLEGEIPRGLFLLPNLTTLYLYNTILSGTIPSDFAKNSKLVTVQLPSNNLTGEIPGGFGELQRLEVLDLFWNQLSGEIPPGIARIPSLKVFKVFGNNLSGILPPEMGLHSKLETLEVQDNMLTGKLPENLCAGKALLGLAAHDNNLIGGIPRSLESCDTLSVIMLHNNQMRGEIQPWFWTLKSLSRVMISNNSFSGELPNNFAKNLTRLEVNDNRFQGEIPANISLLKGIRVFQARNNLLSGQIPVEFTGLSELVELRLDGNSLSGELPRKFLSWMSLSTLCLARNKLSGSIPMAIGSLHNLLDLDLSHNQFSGPIPPELGHLRLNELNLSSNNLFGKIPEEFDRLAFENSFLNNPSLCANSLRLPRCNEETRASNHLSQRIIVLIIVLASSIFLAIVIGLALFIIRWHKNKNQSPDVPTWKMTTFQKLDFTEENILSNLTEDNMIGSGGAGKVYKICARILGEYVAVKRIQTGEAELDHDLEQQFLAEVEILGSIRHSNIVKLMCCISSNEGSKLLVYEYLENESLDRWLHERKKGVLQNVGLDWPKRLQIAIGAAQGLSYMHHDCVPPIVHRDVKSSNILLDCEFNSKIADFGLAKILAKKGDANTMSVVAGSFGYIAPEYAYTPRVNEKIDIYSFGVVLLELVTGKEPMFARGGEHASIVEWAYHHHSEKTAIDELLDAEIQELEIFQEDLKTVFMLGLACTSRNPSNRPSMKEVVQILRRCQPRCHVLEGTVSGKNHDVKPLLANDNLSATRINMHEEGE